MPRATAYSCLNALLELIETLNLREGDRLPSERSLAERLKVSRNTVRETLKELAALGRVEIRDRSGCYVKQATRLCWATLRHDADPRATLDTLAVVAPALAAQAAKFCGIEEARALETHTARLGRALVNHDAECVVRTFLAFFSVMADLTENNYLVLLLQELGAAERMPMALSEMKKADIDAFFALHVGLLQAIRNHDELHAQPLAGHCLEAFATMLGQRVSAARTERAAPARPARKSA